MKVNNFSIYEITETGKIFNTKSNKYLKTRFNEFGYECASLLNDEGHRQNVKVHRLVAMAFIPNPENKPEVNHIDGDKSNNNVSNLEWVTSKENKAHAWKNKLYTCIGENHHSNKYDEACIHKICKLIEDGYRNKEILKIVEGIDKHLIAAIKRGANWVHISKDYNFKITRKERKSPKTIRGICECIVKGYDNSYIAELFSVHKEEINRIRRKCTHKIISDEYF